jgi:dienelactone hydrolase
MLRFLLVLSVASMVGLQGWRTLLNNFAVEWGHLDGHHIGVIQSLREVPGFLALVAVWVMLFVREHHLSALSILVLGIGVAITGFFPILMGLATTTMIMSFGFHYYETTNQSLTLQYFDSKKAPLVMLIHDWDGLTDYEIKRANMLSEHGYAVFAADLFGAGVRPTKVTDKRQHTGELYKNRMKMRSLLKGALDVAKSKGANVKNSVAAGYCFGGAAVLELARSGANLKGFVTFHGGLSTPEGQNYSKTKGELLIMHGTADTAITMDQFAALAKELESAGVPHEMISYGGAQHAFTVFGGHRYQKTADTKSWKRFLEFLTDTLK